MSAWLLVVGCDKPRTDVLQEFPPPRLAREVTLSNHAPRTAPATCSATWRLLGRTARDTYHLYGEGSFELRGEPPTPSSGRVTFETDHGSDRLPKSLVEAVRSRDENAPWVWRLLEVESEHDRDDALGQTGNIGARGVSETELNAVRTRQSHAMTRKLTPRSTDDSVLTFETTLHVDLAAHHITGVTLHDDSTPRRSDLVVQCRLSTAADGE